MGLQAAVATQPSPRNKHPEGDIGRGRSVLASGDHFRRGQFAATATAT